MRTPPRAYANVKLVNGGVFIVLGAVVLARLLTTLGVQWKGIPGYVLGAALIALGVVRLWPLLRGARH